MASKRPTKSKASPAANRSGGGRRRTVGQVNEPVAARALQALILVAGVGLLLAVFFGGRWGAAVVGVLVFASSFPPVRRPVDRWLVGKVRGEEADQAALVRIVAGGLIMFFSFLYPLGF
jgi:hypothetical protein